MASMLTSACRDSLYAWQLVFPNIVSLKKKIINLGNFRNLCPLL